MQRRKINWEATGKRLELLRGDDVKLRKFVCRAVRVKRGDCDQEDCEACTPIYMDHYISRKELAEAFQVSENVIANWEGARSVPTLEDLYFYADICGLKLEDVIVFEE